MVAALLLPLKETDDDDEPRGELELDDE